MLADSAFIQEHDTVTFNKRRIKKGLPQVTPIYTQEDATACLKLFIGVPNEMKFRIDENIKGQIHKYRTHALAVVLPI